MKAARSLFGVLAITLGLAAQVEAATTDPEVIIYRFPGVLDNGTGINVGVATIFQCTNFSGEQENIRLVTRSSGGILRSNFVIPIAHLTTFAFATHPVRVYFALSLDTGNIAQGTTAVAATSTNIVCTAMTMDAASATPIGVALHGVRFKPIPGTQE
jgi:hypothetical protein